MTARTARRAALAVAATVGMVAAGITAVHAEEPGSDATQSGEVTHIVEMGIADEKPPVAVNEVMTATPSQVASALPEGSNALQAEGEECASYRWAISQKQDVLVYNEKWSTFNGTEKSVFETFTTQEDKSWEWHVEGTLSAKVLGVGLDVTGGGGQTFTTSKGMSKTAENEAGKFLTAMHGAWFTKQDASDLTCIHPDGSEGTHEQGSFEIWLPAGADGWMFNNKSPSEQ